ncbi:DPP IV N-terminal domain-containing protein [Pectobacterium carotovorum]|uniref:DPP IV N-terminal domain-containing protein n=1 Tax=Pectobacterium carotovorum TaxID=554 RepID=UPI0029D46458|nr:DPP IV N-terminal domain-containing protein [Pectobacterium carotovorum]MDX6913888.1 DPP IV N-terminal domain-containing protein [Pectobacterium carotovorum]
MMNEKTKRRMTRRRINTLIALLASAALPGAASESPDLSRENYRLIREQGQHYRTLVHHYPGRVVWQSDGQTFFYRRSIAATAENPGGYEFMRVEAASQTQQPAFDHTRLAQALNLLLTKPVTAMTLPFEQIDYNEQAKLLFIPQGSRLLGCDISSYQCRVLSDLSQTEEQSRTAAQSQSRLSPDGQWEALVENHNLVLVGKQTGERLVITQDGTAKNEYEIERLSWSPDSTRLVLFRVQRAEKRYVHYIESSPADQRQPKHRQIFYPKPGDALDIPQPVLVEVASRRITAIDPALFPNPYSLSYPVWRKDGRTFTFDYNQRGHQAYRVIEVESATATPRVLINETSDTFIDYMPLTGVATGSGKYYRHDLADSNEIIWASERSGWQHLYLYDAVTGTVKNAITQGEWVVRAVNWVDEKNRVIYFSASGINQGEDPYYLHGYKIGFDGSGLTALTPESANHTLSFSPNGDYYVDTYSRYDVPPVTTLYRTADNQALMRVNTTDISQLRAAGWRPPIPFMTPGRDGKTEIWGLLYPPRNLKAGEKYPVVEGIYAGPHGSFVPKDFSFWPEPLTELGFAVAKIDGMGTNNRSRAFHDVAWRNLKDGGFPDRILWHQAVARQYPWYDIARGVGITGVSAGGQNAMAALLFHPEFYNVAVADSGSHDNRMDKIWWNEQWMGWPVDEKYADSSNAENAWRLQGKLLLMVGELDENVDPSTTMQVVDKLIKADKDFDLFYLPGGGHGVSGGAYGQRLMWDFFIRHLAGRKTPDWNRPVQEKPPAR